MQTVAFSSILSKLLHCAVAITIGGGVCGAMGGRLPAQEFLAALAITTVAMLLMRSLRSQQWLLLGARAALVAQLWRTTRLCTAWKLQPTAPPRSGSRGPSSARCW